MAAEKSFFPALTGIRAVAVYFIFFKHWNFFSKQNEPEAYLVINQFNSFLTFFFVLSGFVICHKYYAIRKLDKKSLYNYFLNRISRVFPLLFLLVTLTFFLKYLHEPSDRQEILKTYLYNITLFKGFSSKYILSGIGPSWSLSVEELFYLASPLIFLWTVSARSLLKIVCLVYLSGAVLTIFFMHVQWDGFFDHFRFTYNSTFFGRVFEFACGIYLALVVRGDLKDRLLSRLGSRATVMGWLMFLIAFAIQSFIAIHYRVDHATDLVVGMAVNNLVMPVAIVVFFYGLIFHESRLKSMLGSAPMVTLGKCTYSFYLIHTSIIASVLAKYLTDNAFLVLPLLIAVSLLFYQFFEEPVAKFMRRKCTIS